jgi:hypothetical protein
MTSSVYLPQHVVQCFHTAWDVVEVVVTPTLDGFEHGQL